MQMGLSTNQLFFFAGYLRLAMEIKIRQTVQLTSDQVFLHGLRVIFPGFAPFSLGKTKRMATSMYCSLY